MMAAQSRRRDEAEASRPPCEPAAREPCAGRERHGEGHQARSRRRDDEREDHHDAGRRQPMPRWCRAHSNTAAACGHARRHAPRAAARRHVARRQRTRHQHPCGEVIAVHERTEWTRAGVEGLPSPVDQRPVAGRLERDGQQRREQARERDVPDDRWRHAACAGPSCGPEHDQRAQHEPDRVRSGCRRRRTSAATPPRRAVAGRCAARIPSAWGESAVRTAGGSGTSCSGRRRHDASSSPSSIRVSRDAPGCGRRNTASAAAAAITGAAAHAYTPPTAKSDQTIIATEQPRDPRVRAARQARGRSS